MKINLHTHSNYSLDGEYSPEELIKIFKDNNYNIISITDHDTCEAYKHINKDNSIKIINGLEADAIVNNHTYDFLCYNFNLEEVYNFCKQKYETIEKRQTKIFNEVLNYNIDGLLLDDYFYQNTNIDYNDYKKYLIKHPNISLEEYRLNNVNNLVKAVYSKCKEKNIKLTNIDTYNIKKEYAHDAIFRMLDKEFLNKHNIKTIDDFYRQSTINNNFPLYIDMHIVWPDIKELLKIIHNNNGKVFLAHPYRYNKNINEVLKETKDYIDGIEICNNPNNKEEVEYLYNYAKDNNLLVSIGSDYHGNNRYNIDCKYITEEMINDILKWM